MERIQHAREEQKERVATQSRTSGAKRSEQAGWGGVEGQEAAHSGIEMNSESSSSLCRNWDPKAAMRPIDASSPMTELQGQSRNAYCR